MDSHEANVFGAVGLEAQISIFNLCTTRQLAEISRLVRKMNFLALEIMTLPVPEEAKAVGITSPEERAFLATTIFVLEYGRDQSHDWSALRPRHEIVAELESYVGGNYMLLTPMDKEDIDAGWKIIPLPVLSDNELKKLIEEERAGAEAFKQTFVQAEPEVFTPTQATQLHNEEADDAQ